jgi:hypothetical protein
MEEKTKEGHTHKQTKEKRSEKEKDGSRSNPSAPHYK